MPKAKKKLAAAVTLGRLGGKARAEKLSAERRSEIASKAGRSRTKKLTPADRKRVAKLAAEARWQKRRPE
jgi:hypothetical protein